jgi:hypothetical protein
VLSDDHPDTRNSANNLALNLRALLLAVCALDLFHTTVTGSHAVNIARNLPQLVRLLTVATHHPRSDSVGMLLGDRSVLDSRWQADNH